MGRKAAFVKRVSLLTCTLIISACAPAGDREQAVNRSPVPFKASPQEIAEVEVKTLEIGARAPDFKLPGVDDRFYSLRDFDSYEILVILFTCNHCPTAQAYEDRIVSFQREYEPKGVGLAAISPNSPLGLLYEELGYSDMGDSFEEMKIRAEYRGFRFPYLYDGDTQSVSIQYGPVATPHAFVFDRERILRYKGRIDALEKPGTGHAEDLRAAVDALLSGQPVKVPETKPFGCSTKWAWKAEWKKKVDREWNELPVDLQTINRRGLEKLLKNDTGKLLLINVWATWCGPCVIEYPEFIVIHRMYKGRDFEFVSLSADSPDNLEEALELLQKHHSAVRNYIWNSEDHSKLIEAFSPDWEGAIPFTLLVEPGGNRVYAHQNIIDPLEVKRAIVDHPMIGRYY